MHMYKCQLASVVWIGISYTDHCVLDNKFQASSKDMATTDENGTGVYTKVSTRKYMCVHVCVHVQ